MRIAAKLLPVVCLLIVSPVALADGDTPPGTSDTATQPAEALPDAPPKLIPFEYTFHGFIRGGYTYLPFDPAESQIIGRDSGFRIYNTRLEFSGAFGKWVDFDLSVDSLSTIDPTTGMAPIQVGFEDAYTTLHLDEWWLRLGQFKTPYNGEFLLDDQNIPFVRRSMVTEGLSPDESNTPTNGILLDRQLGAMIGGRIGFTEKTGLNLAFAAVNGNGANQARNDNPAIALAARIAFGNEKNLFAVSGYWNKLSAGTLATIETTQQLAGDADFLVTMPSFTAGKSNANFKVFGMVVYKRTTNLTVPANVPVDSLGIVTSVSMPFVLNSIVVEPAVRNVYFRPDSTLVGPISATSTQTAALAIDDATVGINLSPRVIPLRFQLNYTYRTAASVWEEPSLILEAVIQANF